MDRKALKFYKDRNWDSFLDTISEQQLLILLAISNRSMSNAGIATKLIKPVNTISAQISRLIADGILIKTEVGWNAISEKDLAIKCQKRSLLEAMKLDKSDCSRMAAQAAYQALCPIFESLEHHGVIAGNGHHMAQDVWTYVEKMVQDRWR